MTATTPAQAARPTLPLPKPQLVWERHQLFQEPVYLNGWALEDDPDED